MNILSLFVLLPLLMMVVLLPCRNMKQIRAVMVSGSSLILLASVALLYLFLQERGNGNDAEMLFTASTMWYEALNINYSVGVDGVSVAMILLSLII